MQHLASSKLQPVRPKSAAAKGFSKTVNTSFHNNLNFRLSTNTTPLNVGNKSMASGEDFIFTFDKKSTAPVPSGPSIKLSTPYVWKDLTFEQWLE